MDLLHTNHAFSTLALEAKKNGIREVINKSVSEQVLVSAVEVLETRTDWKICGEAANGLEAVEKTAELQPDVIRLWNTLNSVWYC